MVRATGSVASRRRRKRILKQAKGFWGDRRGHFRQSKSSVMRAMAFNYMHRKDRKGDFRSLWIVRLNVAARIHGLSYSRLICGLKYAGVSLNRKMLSEMAIHNPQGFAEVANQAKKALETAV
ncbi:50S ribosomal protein L20 [Chlamydia gallinacea]|uniref:Large ribosomal subunit protein bL20 n=2 Tax=Chlamydia gallinacea TaxID=1457153 RepID=A0A173DY34_9CHLA|nr:50S ribosomal protein L20 [Chlamydia gallinacea]ANG65848.1 50S ribosomal protein L20 [Chlamydia gallinacea 08-1274/3]AQT77096.1 50S ribosomal protein L20 [Chlamydia gallinacea]MBX6680404.1 50S ribosomal protein L20 [Chlamydia gallinacea]MBX6687474.1 50S ribosomal protein L20 [Chlamydia gallinacea]